MKKVTLLLMTLVAVTSMATGQVDVSAVNKPIELLNEANTDIENGDYKDAVQKFKKDGLKTEDLIKKALTYLMTK